MVAYYPSLSPDLIEWFLAQPLFYIASAPLAGAHINLSPKGYPRSTLAVLNPNRVLYLDKTGSGIETISHIYENGRATIMACSFGKSPRIMRLFCRGRVIERAQEGPDGFDAWVAKAVKSGMRPHPEVPLGASLNGIRAAIVLDVFKVQTSCGFAVPILTAFADEKRTAGNLRYLDGNMTARETLQMWNTKSDEHDKTVEYWFKANARSLDGLAGLRLSRNFPQRMLMISRATALRLSRQWDVMLFGALFALFFLLALRGLGLLDLRLKIPLQAPRTTFLMN